MPQQLRVTRKIDVSGAAKIGFNNFVVGDVFYVDESNGADGYGVESRNPNYPLNTISAAYDLVTEDHGDYIIVISDSTEESSYPISADVQGVHLIALAPGSLSGGPVVLYSPGADGISLEAGEAEIAGFSFAADTSYSGIITASAVNWYSHIHDCSFGTRAALLHGIEVDTDYHFTQGLIEDCLFDHGIAGDGIYVDGNFTRSFIKNCIFREVASQGIYMSKSTEGGGIIGNFFAQKVDSDEGCAIYLTGAKGMLIMDNVCGDSAEDPGNTPWFDASTGTASTTLNYWAHNWAGNTMLMPAVT